MKHICIFFILALLSGCSAVDIKQYSANSPQLDLFDYFIGETEGYGIVQDRKGTLTRQFTVAITGSIQSDGRLKLYEKFDWSDGEKSTRTWKIAKNGYHSYSGTAEDVARSADGTVYGNVVNWKYLLNLKVDDTIWKIKFDDWMFLVTEQVLINRAKMSKFGLTVSTAHSSTIENMQLHGTGQAYYLKFIKVYSAALYTEQAASEEEIIQGAVSKCLLLEYEVSLKQKDFIKAANTVLDRQFSAEQLKIIQNEIDLLHAGYVDVVDGDQYTLCYDRQEGSTTLSHNDQEVVRILSKPFAEVYFGIWLGNQSPLDDTLRDNLLARK